MHSAVFKHAFPAGLLVAFLAMLGCLAVPSAPALAATDAGTASGGTTTSAATAAPTPSTSAAATTTLTEPAPSESTSGGAAPALLTPSKLTLATWFGPGFYGHATACGQKMTPRLVGVASRTLPCGTLVQVGYRGHLLTVPVLDRGPYGHNGAMWDLTWGAARALKITETVRITTQIVGTVANSPTLGAPLTAPGPLATGAASAPSAPPATAATTGGATAS
jgi:hypothetical protein